MSLCLFNLFGVGRPTRTRHRDGSGNGVSLHSSGTKQPSEVRPLGLPTERLPGTKPDPSETSPCRPGGHSWSCGSIPRRGDGLDWRSGGGIETPDRRYPSPDRIGSVRHRLARRAASVARAAQSRRVNSSTLISSVSHHRSPAGGQSKAHGVGRGPQHDARGRASRVGRADAVAGGAPVRRLAPRAGPVSPIRVRSCGPSLRQGVGSVHPARNRFRSNGTCFRHRW